MLFLVVTNFGHILSTLSIKGRVILSDWEIIPVKLILTEALTATETTIGEGALGRLSGDGKQWEPSKAKRVSIPQ